MTWDLPCEFLRTNYLTHHFLCLRKHVDRKQESEVEQGLKPMYFDMNREHLT